MAALAADTPLDTLPRAGRESYPAANGVTFYAGGLMAIVGGYLTKWDGAAATDGFLGILLEGVVGDTSATPVPEGRVDTSGRTLTKVAVAGLTNQAAVAQGAKVYAGSDNPADFTLTPTTAGEIGNVVRFHSSGIGDVRLFTPAEYLASL